MDTNDLQNHVKTRTERVKAWVREHQDQAILIGTAVVAVVGIAGSKTNKKRQANKRDKKFFDYIDKKNEAGSTVVITEEGVWFSPPVPITPTRPVSA